MDVAVIGLKAHSEEIKQASKDLDKLTASSKKADVANDNRSASDRRVAASTSIATAATNTNTAAVRAATQAQMALQKASNMAAFRQRQLAVQSLDVAQSLALGMPPMMVAIQQGGQIAGIYAGQGGVAGAFKEAAGMVLRFVRAHPLLTAATAAIGIGFAGITSEIERTTGKSVTMGQVLVATFGVVKDGIGSVLAPAIGAIGPYVSSIWNGIIAATKTLGNTVIGTFAGAFEFIKESWGNIPAVVSDIFTLVAFKVKDTFAIMAQDVIRSINQLIDAANALPATLGLPTFGQLDPQMIQLPDEPEFSAAGNRAFNAFSEAFNVDYMGNFFDAVKTRSIAAFDVAADAASSAGEVIKNAAVAGSDAWEGLRTVTENAVDRMQPYINTIQSAFGSWIDKAIDGTFKLKDAMIDLGKQLLKMAMNQTIMRLFGSLFGGGGGGPGMPINLLAGLGDFSGGGYTGDGPRTGGLDGQGGRLAMIHPKETIIDHTRPMRGMGNNGGKSISINVDARGSTPGMEKRIRAEIDAALSQYDRGSYERFQRNHGTAQKRDFRYRNG